MKISIPSISKQVPSRFNENDPLPDGFHIPFTETIIDIGRGCLRCGEDWKNPIRTNVVECESKIEPTAKRTKYLTVACPSCNQNNFYSMDSQDKKELRKKIVPTMKALLDETIKEIDNIPTYTAKRYLKKNNIKNISIACPLNKKHGQIKLSKLMNKYAAEYEIRNEEIEKAYNSLNQAEDMIDEMERMDNARPMEQIAKEIVDEFDFGSMIEKIKIENIRMLFKHIQRFGIVIEPETKDIIKNILMAKKGDVPIGLPLDHELKFVPSGTLETNFNTEAANAKPEPPRYTKSVQYFKNGESILEKTGQEVDVEELYEVHNTIEAISQADEHGLGSLIIERNQIRKHLDDCMDNEIKPNKATLDRLGVLNNQIAFYNE